MYLGELVLHGCSSHAWNAVDVGVRRHMPLVLQLKPCLQCGSDSAAKFVSVRAHSHDHKFRRDFVSNLIREHYGTDVDAVNITVDLCVDGGSPQNRRMLSEASSMFYPSVVFIVQYKCTNANATNAIFQ